MSSLSRKNHGTISSTEILRHLDRYSYRPTSFVVRIAAGETAWDPTSTKHLISGPAKLTYTQYVDGGVEVVVESADEPEVVA